MHSDGAKGSMLTQIHEDAKTGVHERLGAFWRVMSVQNPKYCVILLKKSILTKHVVLT